MRRVLLTSGSIGGKRGGQGEQESLQTGEGGRDLSLELERLFSPEEGCLFEEQGLESLVAGLETLVTKLELARERAQVGGEGGGEEVLGGLGVGGEGDEGLVLSVNELNETVLDG